MKEQLISFETAKLAKEKGFDIPTKYHYPSNNLDFSLQDICLITNWNNFSDMSGDTDYQSAPTQSLLQKWLREKHKLFINIAIFKRDDTEPIEYDFAITDLNNPYDINDCEIFLEDYSVLEGRNFKTYEEALEKGLFEALKLI